jgi:uncharacterized membrane protein YbhN (UPF0104 family)
VAISVATRVPRAALTTALLVGCLGLLAYQLRSVDFGRLFAGFDLAWACAAVVAIVVSLGAAAHNISAFAPLRLRARDTMRAQLAVGGLRIVAPSAVSTPAIGTRFLARQGLPMTTAITVLAVAQTAQLLMTIVVVGAIAITASTHLPAFGGSTLLIGAIVVVTLAAIGAALPAGRRMLRQAVDAVRTIGVHLRANPHRVVSGLAASGLLTVAHVAAFVCCVHAVGAGAPVLALTAVYLAASGAGSLIPTPGGLGAVESAMISGLIATGLSPQAAAGAALLSRLVTVWIPALPGLWALRALRRDGLV